MPQSYAVMAETAGILRMTSSQASLSAGIYFASYCSAHRVADTCQHSAGWKGETYSTSTKPDFSVLSWEPRIFYAKGLLTSGASRTPYLICAGSGGRKYTH